MSKMEERLGSLMRQMGSIMMRKLRLGLCRVNMSKMRRGCMTIVEMG